MSYPAPPPPGQGGPVGPGGPAGPGGQGPYQPNPYGGGPSPYGQPPKKDNTLWWVLGIIAVVVIVCCIGVCGFFGWFGTFVSDEIDSSSSSYSNSQADGAKTVNEGSQVTDNGATVLGGWRISATDDLEGVSLRNDGTSRDSLRVKFFFLEDGDVIGDASCSSSFLDPGDTDFSPTCIDAIQDISDYDEVRVSEGY